MKNAKTNDCANCGANANIILTLIFSGFWLLTAGVFGLLYTFKILKPSFLAEPCPLFALQIHFNHGVIYAALINSLFYGFALPTLMAFALYLRSRLCTKPIKRTLSFFILSVIWFFALKLGVLALFIGKSSNLSQAHFAMPSFVYVTMLICFILFAAKLLASWQTADELETHDELSIKYTLLFLLNFALFGALSLYTVHYSDSIAVWKTAVAYKFAGASVWLCVCPGVFAVLYYLYPRLCGKNLRNESMAKISFWAIAIMSPWLGMQSYLGAPIPNWLPSIEAVVAILYFLPVFANHLVLNELSDSKTQADEDKNLRVLSFALIAVSAAAGAQALMTFSSMIKIVALSEAISTPFFLLSYGAVFACVLALLRSRGSELFDMKTFANKGFAKTALLHSYATGILAFALFLGGFFRGMRLLSLDSLFISSTQAGSGIAVAGVIGYIIMLAVVLRFLFFLLKNVITRVSLAKINKSSKSNSEERLWA